MNTLKTGAAAAALVMICILTAIFPSLSAEAAGYEAFLPQSEEKGVLTLENGEKWYRVNGFVDGNEYVITALRSDGGQAILAAVDGNNIKNVWTYSREIMSTSVSPRRTFLRSGSMDLSCHESQLYVYAVWYVEGDMIWDYIDGRLCYKENDNMYYLTYDENSEAPFSCTDDPHKAAAVNIYARGEQLSRCIKVHPSSESYVTEGSGYAAPVYTAELLRSDIVVDSVRWFIDGEEQSCGGLTFTADCLRDRPAGVYRVSCIIEGHDDNDFYYKEKSADAGFAVAKGVVPDSVMTFSDIHEEYGLITEAVERVMQRTGGYIPSLIVCTGDMVYGPEAAEETMLSQFYPRMVPCVCGIDAVYVSGNHDSGAAASVMSAAAGLGADSKLPASGGPVFIGTSAAVKENGTSSLSAKGLIVYGLNYEAVIDRSGEKPYYTYANAITELDAFLKKTAEDYHGELVIISAHPGLHSLGIQKGSVKPNGFEVSQWAGGNMYNVDRSYDMVSLINSYAEKYDMDILYLFGHNHSRREVEFCMKDGDAITSTKNFADQSVGTQTLRFTYAHSGYLSTVIGCADSSFSFIRREGDVIKGELLSTAGDGVRSWEAAARWAPAADETASATTSAAAAGAADSPKTGYNGTAVYGLAAAAALMLLSKRKRRA
ncbi:metallophosphoesterase family protein [uncultured Ruminococcus sp.]|uniref:metallophosphoesterase family protein n=1 Tax=uncultured Ruminococcus sp. TaxID=165186 RepID=UPI00262B91A2|nr:metallophosphoesterase family protein [uncultured Ruminococcus sp.]